MECFYYHILKLFINPGASHDGWYPPPGAELEKIRFEPSLPDERSAEIKCGRPRPAHVRHCGGKHYLPCLFNITNDPCEYEDLSKEYPSVYKMMLSRLGDYYRGMVKPRRTTYTDPKANPKIHNGVWLPWKDL